MTLRNFGLLTNENIHPRVATWFAEAGFDVKTAALAGTTGKVDRFVLQLALREQRVVVTHDADFGKLAIAEGEPFCGILHLRPGHIDPTFTIAGLAALLDQNPPVAPPFIIVVRRLAASVRIRVRNNR